MRRFGFICMMFVMPTMTFAGTMEKATFAGGCFWCMEHPFDELDGVVSTTSGYVGGFKKNPTYQQVSAGRTGHTEAVQVVFDPEKVSYETLLNVYWRNTDPTTANRQFCDIGSQYRPGIFYADEAQKKLAEASKEQLQKNKPFEQKIVTEISPVGEFWAAESYHQDYYLKNPLRYRFYRYNCGRDKRLQQLWGSNSEVKHE
jgi:peptide-methionine (S)-S-oxide reductase